MLKILNSKQMQLTIPQALEQGYRYYGYEALEWQPLSPLEDCLTWSPEALKFGTLRLFDKEPIYRSVDENGLRDMVTDAVMDNSSADDTEAVPDALKAEVPWKEFADKINAVLKEHPYYRLTDIKLKA